MKSRDIGRIKKIEQKTTQILTNKLNRMKNKTPHTAHEQGQSLRNILYVWDGIHRNQKMATQKMSETRMEFNIFLIQNKGKGPPGRQRSPGVGDGLFPDHPPDLVGSKPDWYETSHECTLKIIQSTEMNNNTEYQTFNKNQYSNFLHTLNFTQMKKQILFLAFFVLAALASITDSYGQAQPSTIVPRPLTGCDDYPLHPLPGKEYQYQVSNPAGDPVTSYTWWATKDPNFLTATSTANLSPMLTVSANQLISTSPNYGTAAAGSTVSITWSPALLAGTLYQGPIAGNPSPTFVVVKADGACTNNIQVYEINPLKAFTVDIANSTGGATLAYGATESSCVDKVRSATYDNASKQVLMDYGTNTITFEVIAANFVNSWTPRFTIVDGLSGTQSATIGWAYTEAAAQAGTYVESIAGLAEGGTFSGTIGATTTETNTVNGVSIWVTVVIHNHTYESLAVQPFTLAVDGIDSTGQWDLTAVCASGGAADQDDKATQDLLPRPTVLHQTIDAAPAPNDFIQKN